MIPETTRAYVAGFLDAEGSVSIKWGQFPARVVYSTQSNPQILQEMQIRWHGQIKTANKSYFHLQLYSRQAEDFLRAILPYLHQKRDQVALALHFRSTRQQGVRTTPERRQRDMAIRNRMIRLNGSEHRGTQPAQIAPESHPVLESYLRHAQADDPTLEPLTSSDSQIYYPGNGDVFEKMGEKKQLMTHRDVQPEQHTGEEEV
jgi:hypothetical protein